MLTSRLGFRDRAHCRGSLVKVCTCKPASGVKGARGQVEDAQTLGGLKNLNELRERCGLDKGNSFGC